MTLYTGSGNLPHHRYVFVDCSFVRKETAGFEPAVWFGLRAEPGRAWGCHVMLECGAVYRDLPLHALAHTSDPEPWSLDHAQRWNCYSRQWSAVVYDFLAELEVLANVRGDKHIGRYVCTLVPIGDAYSAEPSQGKEHMLLALENGRFTVLPTNYVLFADRSFSDRVEWPSGIRGSDTVWRVNEAEAINFAQLMGREIGAKT